MGGIFIIILLLELLIVALLVGAGVLVGNIFTLLFISYYLINTDKVITNVHDGNLLLEKDCGKIVWMLPKNISESFHIFYSLLFQHFTGKRNKKVFKNRSISENMFVRALVLITLIGVFLAVFTVFALIY